MASPKKLTRVRIKGFLPPSPGAPMPVEGTIGFLAPDDPVVATPKGKRLVLFRNNFKSTDGGETIDVQRNPLRLFIPKRNLAIEG